LFATVAQTARQTADPPMSRSLCRQSLCGRPGTRPPGIEPRHAALEPVLTGGDP